MFLLSSAPPGRPFVTQPMSALVRFTTTLSGRYSPRRAMKKSKAPRYSSGLGPVGLPPAIPSSTIRQRAVPAVPPAGIAATAAPVSPSAPRPPSAAVNRKTAVLPMSSTANAASVAVFAWNAAPAVCGCSTPMNRWGCNRVRLKTVGRSMAPLGCPVLKRR